MRKNTKTRATSTSGKPAIIDFPEFADGREFDALSDADKERVAKYYEQGRHRSELRPLTAAERDRVRAEVKVEKQLEKERNFGGRPKVGEGAKVISLSVEKTLLKRADAYAKLHGLKRAELVAEGLSLVLSREKA